MGLVGGRVYAGDFAGVVEDLNRPGPHGVVCHWRLVDRLLWQLVMSVPGRVEVLAWRIEREGRALWRVVPVSGRQRPSAPGALLVGLRWANGGILVRAGEGGA